MVKPLAPLPVTLGEIGGDWRMAFHCLKCGRSIGPAFYYLRLKWGAGMRLIEMLPRLRCERCSARGVKHECMIVVEPEGYAAAGSPGFRGQRYQLRRGDGGWKPYSPERAAF